MGKPADPTILLVESILDTGKLDQVFGYLRMTSDKQFIITDYTGKICASSQGSGDDPPDDRYIDLPPEDLKENIYFDEMASTLYFRVGNQPKDGYVVVPGVSPEEVDVLTEHLSVTKLAIKTFVNHVSELKSIENQNTDHLITNLLLRNINIKDLLKHTYPLIDINRLYYVCIMEPENTLTKREMDTLLSHSKDWLAYKDLDIICTVWENKYLVFVCPTHYDQKTLEIEYGWEKHIKHITQHQKDILKKFGYRVSFGIGKKYPLPDLHRSYKEAIFALHLSKLVGNSFFIKHFSDLGVFSLICQNEPKVLVQFYEKFLGPVINFDRENQRELLVSLRCLFDANLDVKAAAERLHLHINTLRYRLKQVEELTGMNLQKIEDRANLFVALKIYELMVSSGYVDGISAST